jgi:hypothetical protein
MPANVRLLQKTELTNLQSLNCCLKKASIQTIPSFGKSNKRGAKSKSDLESLVGDVHVCQVLQQAHHLVLRL